MFLAHSTPACVGEVENTTGLFVFATADGLMVTGVIKSIELEGMIT